MAVSDWTVSDWTTLFGGIAGVYLLWKQNRIFERQNEIFAREAGHTAMPTKTSRALQFERYWPTLVMLALMLLIGYNIYDRHHPGFGLVGWVGLIAFVLLTCVGLLFLLKTQKHTFASATENSPIVEQPPAPKLVIHHAVYAAGLPTEVSVTDKLQNIVRDGIAITVDGTLGGLIPDPASGVRKRLDVEYSYGSNTRFHVSRWERPPGEIMRLVLPEDTEVPRLTNEITRTKQQHEVEESRSRQIRDIALADSHADKQRLAEIKAQLELATAAWPGPMDLNSIQGTVLTLAKDIFAFLKERGCEPDWDTAQQGERSEHIGGMLALKSLSVADYAAITGAKVLDTNAAQKTMDAINYGFVRKFKNRLSDLLLELKEHGISDYELEQNANGQPLGTYYCSNIRTIGERLLIVWSRMQS